MMMLYHYNPITLKAFLEQNMVWKLLEIAPSPAARVIMMSFRVALDIIDGIINPIVGIFKAAEKQNRQFGPLWF